MNQARMIEIWTEIIETAKNGDPQYSFRLFTETLNQKKGENGNNK